MRALSVSKKVTIVAASALSTLASFGAMAADAVDDPTQYMNTAFTSIHTQFNSAMDQAWPIITGVTVAFLAVRILKKIGNKTV